LLCCSILLTLVGLGVLIWGLDKGFDITDGGCSVLRYQDIQPSVPCDYWYDHILVKAIVPGSFRSVLDLRWLGFIINLLVSIVFTFAVRSLYLRIHHKEPDLTLMMLSAITGFVASYPGMPSDLSYNSLNQFFLLGSGAGLIFYSSCNDCRAWYSLIITALMISFVYAIKLPSGILITLVAILLITLRSKGLVQPLIFIAALIVFIGILNLAISPGFISHYLKTYRTVVTNQSLHSYSLLYSKTLELSIQLLLGLALSLPVSVLFWLARISSGQWGKMLFTLGGIFGVALFLVRFTLLTIDGEPISSLFIIAIIAFLFYSTILDGLGRRGRFSDLIERYRSIVRYIPVFMMMILLPYIGACGSAVKWNVISKYYFISFTGLIVIMTAGSNLKMRLGASLLMVYVLLASLFVYVQNPFGQSPLYYQTVPYKGIKLDPERRAFMQGLESILQKNSFDPDQGMIVAYTAPGIVYLMNSYHPGGILWKQKREDGYFTNLSVTKLRYKPVVISLHYHPSKEFIDGFDSATGLRFATDYRLVGELPHFDRVSVSFIYFPVELEIRARQVVK